MIPRADCTRLRIITPKPSVPHDDGIKIICSNVKTSQESQQISCGQSCPVHTYALEEERHVTQRRHSHVPSGHAHSASDLRYARRQYASIAKIVDGSLKLGCNRRKKNATKDCAEGFAWRFLNGEIQRRGPNRPSPVPFIIGRTARRADCVAARQSRNRGPHRATCTARVFSNAEPACELAG
ncbi:hypothetical protein EVAR_61727_1 [Eumeta japonica]|uniref:Uncharacterized protein n=1 Tax=Eumeta variegata TaxID=151549 RepID=A0A4C1ZNZ9_EUMVA|nr:hypothetical protein EVAR_61727_1 [Eumeta japonica]